LGRGEKEPNKAWAAPVTTKKLGNERTNLAGGMKKGGAVVPGQEK